MQDKLTELTQKLYGEGLEKGRQEAEGLVAKAQKEAKAIVDKAKRDAEKLLAAAQKDADTAKETANHEIAQAGKNAINVVKQEMENLLINNTLAGATSSAFADAEFVKSLVLAAAERFSPTTGDSSALSVLLPAGKQAELDKVFSASAKKILEKSIELTFDANVKAGFKIAPKNGGYYLTFTEQDFFNLFKEYLRPKVRTLLFGES